MVDDVHTKFHESSPVDSDVIKEDRNTDTRTW
jgi:hypothetical protein